jgi:hypothetical protein
MINIIKTSCGEGLFPLSFKKWEGGESYIFQFTKTFPHNFLIPHFLFLIPYFL